jgi:inner membrane protein YidH
MARVRGRLAQGGTTSSHDGGTAPGTGPGPGAEPSPGAEPGRIPGPGPGREPDARFTMANERTFLAWNRTALALVVAGLGIVQLLPPFPGVPWGRHIIGVPLIVFGAAVSVAAYLEWRRNQAAMARGAPLAASVLPRVLAAVITIVAAVSAVVVLISVGR